MGLLKWLSTRARNGEEGVPEDGVPSSNYKVSKDELQRRANSFSSSALLASQRGAKLPANFPGQDFLKWRVSYACSLSTAHVRMGNFLKLVDHPELPGPNPEQHRRLMEAFEPSKEMDWGKGDPLGMVLNNQRDVEILLSKPHVLRNSITILEPWEHVGANPLGEEVRASINIAYTAMMIAGCDSVVYPAWKTGMLPLDLIIPALTSGVAVIVEGGDQSICDPSSMDEVKLKHEELCILGDSLLLSRFGTCAAIFICLGHQLAAHCHIRLLRSVVEEVLATESLHNDKDGAALSALKQVAFKILKVGEKLPVLKHEGTELMADNWRHPSFSAGKNEEGEAKYARLVPYQSPDAPHIPEELIKMHEEHADEFEGILDVMLADGGKDVIIAMFHGQEVNEESVLLANWGYRLLHDVVTEHRQVLVGTPLSWMLLLPLGVEILASTLTEDGSKTLTEVAATCIAYKSHEDGSVRRSFTCQFHPELMEDLRVFNKRPTSYEEMRQSHGIELFVRMLHAALAE